MGKGSRGRIEIGDRTDIRVDGQLIGQYGRLTDGESGYRGTWGPLVRFTKTGVHVGGKRYAYPNVTIKLEKGVTEIHIETVGTKEQDDG